jgi:hypothetical protein
MDREPSEEQRRYMLRELAKHLALSSHHEKQKKKNPIGVFPIPEQHVEEILTLASDHVASSRTKHNRLWRRVYDIMPATRDYECTLDVSNATNPEVKMMEYQPGDYIQTGKNDVEESYHVSEEHHAEIENLAEFDDKSGNALTRYKLWKRLGELIPEIRSRLKSKWRIYIGADELAVFRYTEEREKRDDADPFEDDNEDD